MEASEAGSDRQKQDSSSASVSAASPISVLCNFWKEFDLEKEKSLLDEQGLRIAENQDNSQKNRCRLSESTRDFKKASPEEKLSSFNTLLKGYQEEVDNLTKRAKFGENAFLNIYQKLYEALDPYPGLASIAVSTYDPYPGLASIAGQTARISELESENRRMKVELHEFRTESTHLKNQQATIRRLEERNHQLEQRMEEKVKEIVEIKQRNFAEDNQKTLEVLKEREQSLQDQLRQAKDSVTTMQKLHELAQSQLFELCAQSEEERAAKQS
ncbi:CASP-like protein [Drosera capensis]